MYEIIGSMCAGEITSAQRLDPRFNAQSRFHILELLDDLPVRVDTKASCTRKRKTIEHKHVDCEVDVRDFTSTMACTNNKETINKDPKTRRDVWTTCSSEFAVGTPQGDAYLARLNEALEDRDVQADFAWYLMEIWKADPTFDRRYHPITIAMARAREDCVRCPAAETLQNFADNYAHEQLGQPRGRESGIPLPCLYAYHKHLGHGCSKSTLKSRWRRF